MVHYAKTHWRGELSLAQSYWVNGVLVSILLTVGLTVAEQPLSSLGVETAATTFVFLLVSFLAIWVWQWVGVWRSATNSAIRTGRVFWPTAAKAMVILGLLGTTGTVVTTTNDVIKMLGALRAPLLASYLIERQGETDLILTGAINDRSVAEVIDALQDPSVEILRVNSGGGLHEASVRLARYIRQNEVMVMAEGQCLSACVHLLAASPYAAVYPGTQVTFHRVEPVAEYSNPDIRRESKQYLKEAERESEALYREFGVAEWAIQTARRNQLWTPTLDELISMNLIVYVFDIDLWQFVPAEDYCAEHLSQCLR